MRTITGLVRIALATVMAASNGPTTDGSIPWQDRSGQAALVACTLLALITFFTSHSHVDILAHASVEINQQIKIPLLVAALALLVGEDEVCSEGVV